MPEDRIAQGKSIWRQAATGKFIVPSVMGRDLAIENKVGLIVRAAHCFDITNVAEYFYAGTDKDEWYWDKDIPCMAPPFETTWLEFGVIESIKTKNGMRFFDPEKHAPGHGVLLRSHRVSEIETVPDFFGSVPKDEIQKWINGLPEDGWVVEANTFVRVTGMGVVLWPVHYLFDLDNSGKPTQAPRMLVSAESRKEVGDEIIAAAHTGAEQLFPHALAIAFLHCKNIRVGEKADERRPADRARDLRAGVPEVKFKTLEIEPMRKVLASEGGIAENGLKKALHICRGHFSHYSEERPLFGKYAGQFWIPAHIRGTTESGQVIKDYKVNAPRNVAA